MAASVKHKAVRIGWDSGSLIKLLEVAKRCPGLVLPDCGD